MRKVQRLVHSTYTQVSGNKGLVKPTISNETLSELILILPINIRKQHDIR